MFLNVLMFSATSLLQFAKDLFTVRPGMPHDQDDEYLAESTDIYDLERRMRQLDTDRQGLYAAGTTGFFPH